METTYETAPARDRALMERLALGDREALGELMERHYRRLYRILLGYLRNADDALDAVQETFVRACEHAARWNREAEVAPWLTRIAVNQAIDRLRRRKRRSGERSLDDDEPAHELRAEVLDADQLVYGREIQERLTRALEGLPEGQRAVFVLRHYQQLPLDEIAGALEMNLGTVKSSLHRALQHLRRRMASLRPS